MKTTVVACALIATAVAGCASHTKYEEPGYAYGCPVGAEKIKSKEQLVKAKVEMAGSVPHVEVADLRCAQRNDQLRVDVDLRNTSNDVRRIAWKVRWMDKDGMRAWDDETWKPVLIYGNTIQTLTTQPPSQEATDFRVVVMDQDK
ncbi:MAG TPA: YcfL family protein [Burkholderiales bacterium]|nr:YcfL family protein [Burkholderiales bacterium]